MAKLEEQIRNLVSGQRKVCRLPAPAVRQTARQASCAPIAAPRVGSSRDSRTDPCPAQLHGSTAHGAKPKSAGLGLIFCPHLGLGAMPVRFMRAVLTTPLAIEIVGAAANLLVQFRRRGLSRPAGPGRRMRRRNRNCGGHLPGSGVLRSGLAGRFFPRGGFLWSGRIRRFLILSHSCSLSPHVQSGRRKYRNIRLSYSTTRVLPAHVWRMNLPWIPRRGGARRRRSCVKSRDDV